MDSIDVDRLQPGVFISLAELGWMRHPFMLNEFVISSDKQIRTLRELGIRNIRWDPQRSTNPPLPEPQSVVADEEDLSAGALDEMLAEKRARMARLREQREGLARRERDYEHSAQTAGNIFRRFPAACAQAHTECKELVTSVVDNLIGSESMVIHLVNQKVKESGIAFHSLNVMVLSLLLGRTVRLNPELMRLLGVGALLHDIGKTDIPVRILRSRERSKPEEAFYQAHVGYGIKAVSGITDLPVQVRNIIACHHEHVDGSGFPNRLQGNKIPVLARIVAIANRYDNLCNPFEIAHALTPAEALKQMFSKEGAHFDADCLKAFIKTMGVYPPGSFVQLEGGAIGLVVETNADDLLHPMVMLHDADIPRSEAMILDLREIDQKVIAAVNPATLPIEVVEYLAPRGRLDYYVEAGSN